MMIYLDFDGTVVEHRYPEIGRYNRGAFETIGKLQKAGHQVILNTYRADIGDGTLEKALNYIHTEAKNMVDRIESWCTKKLHPAPWNLETSITKGEIFIDDISAGIPLIPTVGLSGGQMVNWTEVERQLKQYGLLP